MYARITNGATRRPGGGRSDAQGQGSRRRAWPLGLHFWGDAWSLAAWCELRRDFRNFRLDRIAKVTATGARYPDEPGRRLEDFVRKMQAD